MFEPVGIELLANRSARTDWHRALHRQHSSVGYAACGELAHNMVYRGQVSVARVHRGRPHADKQDARLADKLGEIERKTEPRADCTHALLEPWLVDRDVPVAERIDSVGVDITNEHVVAKLGEASACDQADPPGPDDADFLRLPCHLGAIGNRRAGR